MIKVISGGQTGADLAGLEAARSTGLETGGTAPKGWRICLPDGSNGANPTLKNYGLVEHASSDYPPRTRQNILDADGTVWFGYADSPGGRLTKSTCQKAGKPYLEAPETPEIFCHWITRNNIKVLNVAGNRASTLNPGIYVKTYSFLLEAFLMLENNKEMK